jgi:lysophospholipase L1-like esterase
MALHLPRVSCVDAYDISLNSVGQARHQLFLDDKLHFNAEGYKLLAERVRPYMPTPK